ncbi:MAG: hypothetical protein V4727_12495 [Verrucomicrobiota bacterium]
MDVLYVGQETMHFRITGDSDVTSGVGAIITAISSPTRMHFIDREYGAGLAGVVACLMCQDPALALKQRVRHSKKDKTFYVDVMLDLPSMCAAAPSGREGMVFCELITQLGIITARRKITDFDSSAFLSDLHDWLTTWTEKKIAQQVSGGNGDKPP